MEELRLQHDAQDLRHFIPVLIDDEVYKVDRQGTFYYPEVCKQMLMGKEIDTSMFKRQEKYLDV